MATRFYPTVKAPNAIIHGGTNGTWAQIGVMSNSYNPVQWQFRMSTSKVNGGTHATHQIRTNQQGNFDFLFLNLWTPPLQAQTVSGTFDLCFLVAQSWLDDIDPPADLSVVRWRVHVYITVGQTTEVRHVLLDNYTDSNNFPFLVAAGTRFASPQTLTAGAAQSGDCVRIELGLRVVSSPTPDVTQPPVNMTRIMFTGTGTVSANGDTVQDSTDLSLNSWLEFSHDFTFADPPDPPANDDCASAIDLGSVTSYQGDFIDASQSADTERSVWWKWTAPSTGSVCVHTLGANYGNRIWVYEDGCGSLNNPAGFEAVQTYLSQHRSQSSTVFHAVEGIEYLFEVRNLASTFNATYGGGMCRIGLFNRQEPQEDDLFLPAQNLIVYREGIPVNMTGAFAGQSPSGIAIDYTGRPMDDLNGGTHEGVRVLLGLFSSDLVEVLDAITLSYGDFQSEIDYISAPWHEPSFLKHPSTLYITAAGQLFVALFGTGFEYVAGIGTLPALMNVVSDDPADGHVRELSATDGDNQAGAPFTAIVHPTQPEITASWVITMDEDNGIIYYTSGGIYGYVGNVEIRAYNTATQDITVFATVSPAGGNNAGIKGLQFIPGGGMLVCNGNVVQRLDAAGAVIGTFTPSVALDSRALVDVKLTADATAFWAVDLDTVRLYKVNLSTMEEIATYETFLEPGTLTQMAIYQPSGVIPPIVIPPQPEEEECPATLIEPPPRTALERFFRVHGPKERSPSAATADAQYGDFAAALGDTSFGQLPLGASGVRRRPGLGIP